MTEETTNWDLTGVVSPYLDRHMVFPLLEYLAKSDLYKSADILNAKIALLESTNMVDYAIENYETLEKPVPDSLKAQKETVLKEKEQLANSCKPILDLDEEQTAKMKASGSFNPDNLAKLDSNITTDVIQSYQSYAQFLFQTGDYQAAQTILENYIALFASPAITAEDDDEFVETKKTSETGNQSMYWLKTVDADMLKILWGKLACEILLQKWQAASVAVEAVQTAIEQVQSLSPIQLLQQRTWLLHWSLFVYWNYQSGLNKLVDLFTSNNYKQAIMTNAPHLLRYLTAAVVICKRKFQKADHRKLLRQLIYLMEDCEYNDPIVEFVNHMIVKFDFSAAQTKLVECERVLLLDFFLCQQTKLFMEEARVFVFENYCRIHEIIDLNDLGAKINMSKDDTERWMVDLIRNAGLDAKIDSENGNVIMGANTSSVYEQVMDRTRDLNVRTSTLIQSLNNSLNDARKEKLKQEKLVKEAF